MEYCEKHNRNKLLSKYPDKRTGEKTFWCPDCYDEYKKTKGQGEWLRDTPKKENGNALIMEELVAINGRLDKLIAFVVNKLGK